MNAWIVVGKSRGMYIYVNLESREVSSIRIPDLPLREDHYLLYVDKKWFTMEIAKLNGFERLRIEANRFYYSGSWSIVSAANKPFLDYIKNCVESMQKQEA